MLMKKKGREMRKRKIPTMMGIKTSPKMKLKKVRRTDEKARGKDGICRVVFPYRYFPCQKVLCPL